MAASSYPHMVFAADSSALSKASLAAHLTGAFPGDRLQLDEGPLKVVATIDGLPFTFWFDDDAEGLAERYADYLPETARRRRLIACTTMIDASSAPDEGAAHAGVARELFAGLAELEKVWVFSETDKRFVGLDYGDAVPAPDFGPEPVAVAEPMAVPEFGPEPVAEPEHVAEPAAEPEPVPVPQHAVQPHEEPAAAPAAPDFGPEPTPGVPGTGREATEPAPAVPDFGPEPVAAPEAEAAPQEEPAAAPAVPDFGPEPAPRPASPATPDPAPAPEREGFFRRVFGRRNRS